MDQNTLYRDIAGRCDGDIYLGVVGPVRTGKSTFIKRFMELLVLPEMEDGEERRRAVDELPQSGAGRTIMTTQPLFVPSEAARLSLRDGATARVRLVDCVGYLVPGAEGLTDGGEARIVRTPWFDRDIPFEEAAELGMDEVARRAIGDDYDLSLLTDPTELALSRKLSEFPDLIASCARDRAPFRITHFCEELASTYHSFYHDCQVLPSEGRPLDDVLSRARLAACDAVRVNLEVALRLIGVSAPEVM